MSSNFLKCKNYLCDREITDEIDFLLHKQLYPGNINDNELKTLCGDKKYCDKPNNASLKNTILRLGTPEQKKTLLEIQQAQSNKPTTKIINQPPATLENNTKNNKNVEQFMLMLGAKQKQYNEQISNLNHDIAKLNRQILEKQKILEICKQYDLLVKKYLEMLMKLTNVNDDNFLNDFLLFDEEKYDYDGNFFESHEIYLQIQNVCKNEKLEKMYRDVLNLYSHAKNILSTISKQTDRKNKFTELFRAKYNILYNRITYCIIDAQCQWSSAEKQFLDLLKILRNYIVDIKKNSSPELILSNLQNVLQKQKDIKDDILKFEQNTNMLNDLKKEHRGFLSKIYNQTIEENNFSKSTKIKSYKDLKYLLLKKIHIWEMTKLSIKIEDTSDELLDKIDNVLIYY